MLAIKMPLFGFSRRRFWGRWSVGLIGSLLSGCSSVWFDPYIDLPDRNLASEYGQVQSFPRLLSVATEAEALRQTARNYRENLQIGRSVLGYAVFGAAAAGGVAALYGAHRDTVLGLGVGAAGAYGASSLFASTDRVDIYSAANRALNCVVAKAEFVLGTARSLDELTREQSGYAKNAAELETLTNTLNFSSDSNLEAETLIALRTYEATIGNLETFAAQDPHFAVATMRARNAIIFAMEEKIRVTQPDLDSILKVAQGIGTAGVAYTKAVTPTPPAPDEPIEAAALELERLKPRLEFLIKEVSAAADAINSAITKATNEIDQVGTVCVLDLPEIAKLAVSSNEISIAKDQTVTVTSSGGKLPLLHTWRGTTPKSDQIDIVLSGREIIIIGKSALGTLPANTELELIIRDSLAAPNEVVIKVKPQVASPQS